MKKQRPDRAENLPAERACLAGLLMAIDIDAVGVREVAVGLEAGAFTDPVHREVVSCIHEALDADRPGIGAVQSAARRRVIVTGQDHHDVIATIADLCEREYVGSRPVENARLAAHEVRQAHGQRQALMAMTTGLEGIRGARDATSIGEVIERLQAIRGQAEPVQRSRLLTGLDAIDAMSRDDEEPVVPTSFGWTDDAIGGGLPVGGLVALVAPPSVGKSALALQWIVGALLRDTSLRAVWAAGEMTMKGIGKRLVAVGSGLVDGCERVRKNDASRQTARSGSARAAVAAAVGDRLTFVQPPLTVAKIDAAVSETGAQVCMVDYLQLVTVPDGGRDRVADLDRVIGGIRNIATGRDAAVIVASSMSKVAGTTSRAGQLARGSAELDYAADIIFLGDCADLDRDGKPVEAPDGTIGVNWRCRKNRNGEPHDLILRFEGDYQTYGPGTVVEEYAELGAGAFAGGRPR